MVRGVSDEARQQLPDVRVRLPRRQHRDSWLHRNVTLRAGEQRPKVNTETQRTICQWASSQFPFPIWELGTGHWPIGIWFSCLRVFYFDGPSAFDDPPRSMRRPSGNVRSRELARSEPS